MLHRFLVSPCYLSLLDKKKKIILPTKDEEDAERLQERKPSASRSKSVSEKSEIRESYIRKAKPHLKPDIEKDSETTETTDSSRMDEAEMASEDQEEVGEEAPSAEDILRPMSVDTVKAVSDLQTNTLDRETEKLMILSN